MINVRDALLEAAAKHVKLKPLSDSVSMAIHDDPLMESYLSPYDTNALAKKISDNPSDSSGWGAGIKNVLNKMGRPTEDVTYEDIMRKWKRESQPTDVDEVVDILVSFGFSKKLVIRTMNKLMIDHDTGSSPAIDRLGKAIKKSGIQTPIIKYLEKSISLNESVLFERKLTDAGVKEIFKALLSKKRDEPKAEVNATYMKKWSSEFKNANPSEKLRLSIEMIDYLKDRVGTNEHEVLANGFIAMLKRSDLPEYMTSSMINDVKNGNSYTKVRIDPNDTERNREWWAGTKNKRPEKEQKPDIPSNYLNNWAKEFNSAGMQGKIRLAKEATNFLSDRYGSNDHEAIASIVLKVIRNSYLPNNIVKGVFKRVKDGSKYPMKESLTNNEYLETVFRRLLESKDIATYGRLKK